MNKTNIPEPDLDNLLKQTLKDDLPPDVEDKMNRQFLNFKRTLDRKEQIQEPNRHLWVREVFRKEILAVASAAMIILGLGMQMRGPQSALAHSIEQLKVFVPISTSLNRASSMDCTVLKRDAEGAQTSYRIRWIATGDVRVDMNSSDYVQTLWISKETVSITSPGSDDVHSMALNTMMPGPAWQPAMEFLSPTILAKQMQGRYGLIQSSGTNEFLIAGSEGLQDVEIALDAKTYLPKVFKRYSIDSNRTNGTRNCLMEVRFLWNQPIPAELFIPRTPIAAR
jgi:hypothetical protein